MAKKKIIPEGVVLGPGKLRVMGRSGDAPVLYTRIRSLEELMYLPTEEQRAIEEVQKIVREAQQKGNTVHAITKFAEDGNPPVSRPLTLGEFDPRALELVITPRIIGG